LCIQNVMSTGSVFLYDICARHIRSACWWLLQVIMCYHESLEPSHCVAHHNVLVGLATSYACGFPADVSSWPAFTRFVSCSHLPSADSSRWCGVKFWQRTLGFPRIFFSEKWWRLAGFTIEYWMTCNEEPMRCSESTPADCRVVNAWMVIKAERYWRLISLLKQRIGFLLVHVDALPERLRRQTEPDKTRHVNQHVLTRAWNNETISCEGVTATCRLV
jgi:hypothetical protein